MEATKLDGIREMLLQRREELRADLEGLDAEMRTLGMDQDEEHGGLGNHFAEDGTNVIEQERIAALSDDIRSMLQHVDQALDRIKAGTYGKCQRCGKPIMEERLEAFPYVAYCIECQSILEQQNARRPR